MSKSKKIQSCIKLAKLMVYHNDRHNTKEAGIVDILRAIMTGVPRELSRLGRGIDNVGKVTRDAYGAAKVVGGLGATLARTYPRGSAAAAGYLAGPTLDRMKDFAVEHTMNHYFPPHVKISQ